MNKLDGKTYHAICIKSGMRLADTDYTKLSGISRDGYEMDAFNLNNIDGYVSGYDIFRASRSDIPASDDYRWVDLNVGDRVTYERVSKAVNEFMGINRPLQLNLL
jgi:hypothetical protein